MNTDVCVGGSSAHNSFIYLADFAPFQKKKRKKKVHIQSIFHCLLLFLCGGKEGIKKQNSYFTQCTVSGVGVRNEVIGV